MSLFAPCAQVFWMTLPSREDRQRHMEQQLSKYGVSAEKVIAQRPDDPGGFATVGQRGNYLTHIQILKEIWARNLSDALVLEDDSVFQNIPMICAAMAEAFTLQWDMFYLYPGKKKLNGADYQRMYEASGAVATNAYIIRRSKLSQVIRVLEECYARAMQGDQSVWDTSVALCKYAHPDMKVVTCKEYLVYQGKFGSDICPDRDKR